MGLEIELNLTDEAGDPAMLNATVLEAIADNDFTTELAQFNVEINIPPKLLTGDVFSGLEQQVRDSLNNAEDKSRGVGAHMMLVGILPTISDTHLNGEALSANPRYKPPQRADLRRPRGGPADLDHRPGAAEHVRGHDRAGGRVHERAAPPAGRPRALRHDLERRAGDRRRAARDRRELAVLLRPRAVAGDADRALRAGHRHPARRSSRPRACARGCGSASAGSPRSSTSSRRTSRSSRRCCRCASRRTRRGARGRRRALARRAAPPQRHDLPLEPADLRRRPRQAAPARREPRAPRRPDRRRHARQRRLLLRAREDAGRGGPPDLVADVVLGRRGELPRRRARRDRRDRVLARARRGARVRARAAAAAPARPRRARRGWSSTAATATACSASSRRAAPPTATARPGRPRRSTSSTTTRGSSASRPCAR